MTFESVMTTSYVSGGIFRELFFGESYDSAPSFLALLVTYAGCDNAHLRHQSLNLESAAVGLMVEKDTTQDFKIDHMDERKGYMAFGGSGELTAAGSPLSDGQTTRFHIDIDESGRLNDLNVTRELVHTRDE